MDNARLKAASSRADVDVLALIDNAVADCTVSGDAMRWAAPWDEPVVRDPMTPIELLTHRGWDGYAATSYTFLALKVTMRAIGAAFQQFASTLRKAYPTLARAAEVAARTEKHKPPMWAVMPQRSRRRR